MTNEERKIAVELTLLEWADVIGALSGGSESGPWRGLALEIREQVTR